MQAAERIFEGEFEDVMDDAEESSAVAPAAGRSAAVESRPRMIVGVVITVMVASSSYPLMFRHLTKMTQKMKR